MQGPSEFKCALGVGSLARCHDRQRRNPRRFASGEIRYMFVTCKTCENWLDDGNAQPDGTKARRLTPRFLEKKHAENRVAYAARPLATSEGK